MEARCYKIIIGNPGITFSPSVYKVIVNTQDLYLCLVFDDL